MVVCDIHHKTSPSSVDGASPYNPDNVLLSMDDLKLVLKEYGHDGRVRDIATYRKAFTHRSYCTRKNENFVEGNASCPPDCIPLQEESSERMEFLGDAVLNLVVAEYLFDRYPDEHEGFLTRMRSKLVNGDMLRELCLKANLHTRVLISKQIEDAGGRQAKNVLEDCFEAFIGAIFMDGNKGGRCGYVDAANWVTTFLESNIDFSELVAKQNSYKDMLTKYFQYAYNCAPRYIVDEAPVSIPVQPHPQHRPFRSSDTVTPPPLQSAEVCNTGMGMGSGSSTSTNDGGRGDVDGPPQSAMSRHQQQRSTAFTYTVCIKTRDDVTIGTGFGTSKKVAENEAARRALAYFGQLRLD